MFRREWFAILDARPTEMKRTIRYWDLAANEAPSRLVRLHYAAVLARRGDRAETQRQISAVIRERSDYFVALALTPGADWVVAANRILAAAPDRWRVRLRRGESALAEKRVEEAAADFRRVLRQVRSPRARLGLGRLHLAVEPNGDPITNLRRLIQLQPKNAEAHRLLGAGLFASGRGEEALRWLEAALRLDPADPEAHLLLAEAYARAGRTEDAKAFAENILLFWSEHPQADRARQLAGR